MYTINFIQIARYFFLFFLIPLASFGEEHKNFSKFKKPFTVATCKAKNNSDCLAFKYIQHFHPNAKETDWFRNTSVTHYFDFKVTYQNEREKGDINFSFQSYSDGLEWNYWEESIIIRIKTPTQLIDSKNIEKKIIEKLESKFDNDFKIEKITKTIDRSMHQSQTNPKEFYSIKEDIKYKIWVNKKNIIFDTNGVIVD